jgi:hypothetical protein
LRAKSSILANNDEFPTTEDSAFAVFRNFTHVTSLSRSSTSTLTISIAAVAGDRVRYIFHTLFQSDKESDNGKKVDNGRQMGRWLLHMPKELPPTSA